MAKLEECGEHGTSTIYYVAEGYRSECPACVHVDEKDDQIKDLKDEVSNLTDENESLRDELNAKE